MPDKSKLNRQQMIFAEEWIKTGKIRESAITAGYSEKSAHTSGNRLLKNEKVLEYIRMRMRTQDKERVASAEEVLAWLTATMRGEIQDQFGLEASLADRIKAAQELMKRHAVAEQAESKNNRAGKQIKIQVMPMPEDEGMDMEGLDGYIADTDAE